MVEDGVTDLDDVLGDRCAVLKSGRERAKAAMERIKVQSAPQIALERAGAAGSSMRPMDPLRIVAAYTSAFQCSSVTADSASRPATILWCHSFSLSSTIRL